MKKTIGLALFLLLVLVAPAKEIKGMLGINWNKYLFSSESSGINQQNRTGFHAGLGWAFDLNPNMQLEIETLFSEKGAKAKLPYAPGSSISAVYKNSSIGIPILFKYRWKKGSSPYAALGPEFNFVLTHKLAIPEREENIDISDSTNKFIMAIHVALGYELPLGKWGLFAEARYDRWLSDLLKIPGTTVKSESVSLVLGGTYFL